MMVEHLAEQEERVNVFLRSTRSPEQYQYDALMSLTYNGHHLDQPHLPPVPVPYERH